MPWRFSTLPSDQARTRLELRTQEQRAIVEREDSGSPCQYEEQCDEGRLDGLNQVVVAKVVIAEQDSLVEQVVEESQKQRRHENSGELESVRGLGAEEQGQDRLRAGDAEQSERHKQQQPGREQPIGILGVPCLVIGDCLLASSPDQPGDRVGERNDRGELTAPIGAEKPGDEDSRHQVHHQRDRPEAKRRAHKADQTSTAERFGLGLQSLHGCVL